MLRLFIEPKLLNVKVAYFKQEYYIQFKSDDNKYRKAINWIKYSISLNIELIIFLFIS